MCNCGGMSSFDGNAGLNLLDKSLFGKSKKLDLSKNNVNADLANQMYLKAVGDRMKNLSDSQKNKVIQNTIAFHQGKPFFSRIDGDEKTTTGTKIKGAINDGTINNTATAAASWLNVLQSALHINDKSPVSNGTTNNYHNSTDNEDDDKKGIPTYIWYVSGGIILLLGIWAFVHFKQES